MCVYVCVCVLFCFVFVFVYVCVMCVCVLCVCVSVCVCVFYLCVCMCLCVCVCACLCLCLCLCQWLCVCVCLCNPERQIIPLVNSSPLSTYLSPGLLFVSLGLVCLVLYSGARVRSFRLPWACLSCFLQWERSPRHVYLWGRRMCRPSYRVPAEREASGKGKGRD